MPCPLTSHSRQSTARRARSTISRAWRCSSSMSPASAASLRNTPASKRCTGAFANAASPCSASLATSFGHQEPGDEAAIQKFCTDKYDVTFPMFAKIEVNGENPHPLFKALKQEAPGLLGTQAIKWNFSKFLVDRRLRVVRRYAPNDKPEKLSGDISTRFG